MHVAAHRIHLGSEFANLRAQILDAILKAIDDRNDDFIWQTVVNLTSAYLLDGWDGEPTSAFPK